MESISKALDKNNKPAFRELIGKYWVMGFFIMRRSFQRLPPADKLKF
jgi:hypothetical protein